LLLRFIPNTSKIYSRYKKRDYFHNFSLEENTFPERGNISLISRASISQLMENNLQS